MTEPARPRRQSPLPNVRGIGALIAGVEEQIMHRQPVQDVVEEHSQRSRITIGGVTLHLPDEPPPEKEPPDRSGASL